MSFSLPTFNLFCNIFTVSGGAHFFRSAEPCNLAMGRRVTLPTPAGEEGGGIASQTTQLLLPARTDIRDASCGTPNDVVEVPAGSGRTYLVFGVDDVGKGFPNEYRLAYIGKIWNFPGNGAGMTAPWPTPIP